MHTYTHIHTYIYREFKNTQPLHQDQVSIPRLQFLPPSSSCGGGVPIQGQHSQPKPHLQQQKGTREWEQHLRPGHPHISWCHMSKIAAIQGPGAKLGARKLARHCWSHPSLFHNFGTPLPGCVLFTRKSIPPPDVTPGLQQRGRTPRKELWPPSTCFTSQNPAGPIPIILALGTGMPPGDHPGTLTSSLSALKNYFSFGGFFLRQPIKEGRPISLGKSRGCVLKHHLFCLFSPPPSPDNLRHSLSVRGWGVKCQAHSSPHHSHSAWSNPP